ncbi:MAG: NFACT RNA binding domain-containing protein, partial [Asgard group archaeon]
KKHLKEKDIFLHAEIHGAPHTIIKLEQLETVPETTLSEAAQFAVSYSKGWKENLGAADAYWVKPSQVSFSAPSGQYLPKGGVMIYGERNYLKGIPLELGVGLDIREDFAQVVGGPSTAIQKQARIYVLIKPNDEAKGKIAKKIKDFFLKNVEDEDKEKVKVIDLNEIIAFIPGPSKIVETETLKIEKSGQ